MSLKSQQEIDDFYDNMLVLSKRNRAVDDALRKYFFDEKTLNCIIDKEGKMVAYSILWLKLLGVSPITLDQKKFIDFVHPDDIEDTMKSWQEGPLSGESIYINRYQGNEKVFYVAWLNVRVTTEDGKTLICQAVQSTKEEYDRFRTSRDV